MHLLSATAAGGSDVEEAVDLDQTPGDILVLSAADTELGCLARARAACATPLPGLRLANLLKLSHPYSVDLYVEKTVRRSRLVVLRLLGGRSYWSYGLEQIVAACREEGIPLAVLPGDDKPDPELARLTTMDPAAAARVWAYLIHGGIANAEHCLRYLASLLGREIDWREPRPLPAAAPWFPDLEAPEAELLSHRLPPDRPVVPLLFYRALFASGDLAPIEALVAALEARDLAPLPIYVTSLKDPHALRTVEALLARHPPAAILNATAFATGTPGTSEGGPLARFGVPVSQLVFAGRDRASWRADPQGLGPRDLAMQVALPEVDGRILTRAVAFKELEEIDPATQCPLLRYRPLADRIDFTADLAAAWIRLARTAPGERRIALLLANYPSRDGRIANGVGLDTPESCVAVLRALAEAGHAVESIPADGGALMERLLAGPTNRPDRLRRAASGVRLPLAAYRRWFESLPEAVRERITARWGPPEADPHLAEDAFALALLPLGNIVLGIQPARGYHLDPAASYHSPDLPPPHGYLAFYLWLREIWNCHAVIHLGKHGNLEWLPGKALALSESCLPETALGPVPHLYPFIVNDPGEGSQAKRRAAAVILDHLTPPLTRAETYGPLRELERLVDEYWEASQLDPRRTAPLAEEILAAGRRLGLDRDLGLEDEADTEVWLQTLDNHLCALKELQIRDGLHVFGRSPKGPQRIDTLVAIARIPRGDGRGPNASILRALATDLGLGEFDPLDCRPADPWQGPRPAILAGLLEDPWRSAGDAVERLERLARALVAGEIAPAADWRHTRPVLDWLRRTLAPALDGSGRAEMEGLLRGLSGGFVPPGPSGAPTRGRPEVLPTGRNFYAVDTRAVPTPTAFALGWKAAEEVVAWYLQNHGRWPERLVMSAWGTANMRTGGDDIAQALALLGCRPVWEPASQRVTGVEVLPAEVLGRPRVDVTLRVSGFFRDAFPAQMELFDDAVRAVAARDEPPEVNPLAAAVAGRRARLEAEGIPAERAQRLASLRLFGSMPGAYGAGLQALIDEGGWQRRGDLAEAFLAWSGFAYGRGLEGEEAGGALRERLGAVDLVLHNQDNREHDILDSDDYYQFIGGLVAAAAELSGREPEVLFGDHSRPETPRVRRLKEEIGRVVRGRAANPKWIRGVMRHGYKGAFEMAATLDYLFAFAATTRLVEDHHFDALFEAYLQDPEVRGFLAENNPEALREMADRFAEALERGLWHPHGNRVAAVLDEIRGSRDRAGAGCFPERFSRARSESPATASRSPRCRRG